MDRSVQFPNELLSLGAESVNELDKYTNLLGVAFDLGSQTQLTGAVISDEMKAVSTAKATAEEKIKGTTSYLHA